MADLQAMISGKEQFDTTLFKDKIVIIGLSAPGVAVVKPTSSSQAMDDNEILATAIDDGLNGTSLRSAPMYAIIFITLAVVLILSWSFVRGVNQSKMDLLFGVGQVGLLGITFLSVSYTNYMIDLTMPFNVGLAYFVIARGYYAVNEASWRGMESFWDRLRVDNAEQLLLVVAEKDDQNSMKALERAKLAARTITPVENLLLLSEIIEDRSFLGKPVSDMVLFMAFLDTEEEVSRMRKAIGEDEHFLRIRVLDVNNLDLEKVRIEIWRTVLSDKLLSQH
jgi:hypothetical protein